MRHELSDSKPKGCSRSYDLLLAVSALLRSIFAADLTLYKNSQISTLFYDLA